MKEIPCIFLVSVSVPATIDSILSEVKWPDVENLASLGKISPTILCTAAGSFRSTGFSSFFPQEDKMTNIKNK